jgi:hypothetical protein
VVNTIFPTVGKISGISPIGSIGQNDPVNFVGYASSHVNAVVSELNIWKEIKISNSPVCFGDLMVLDHPSYNYITVSLAKPGDSGAWVVNTSNNVATWDGMLIGGDGIRAYCCFSENIMNTLTLANQPLVLP